MAMVIYLSVPVSMVRPFAGLPSFGCGPKPAAVRFKAAFRAAGRPESTTLDMAGPRPARGLTALLVRKPTMLVSVLPDPEAPVLPPVFQAAPEGRAGKRLVQDFRRTERKKKP